MWSENRSDRLLALQYTVLAVVGESGKKKRMVRALGKLETALLVETIVVRVRSSVPVERRPSNDR
jgi:hypothetical protein